MRAQAYSLISSRDYSVICLSECVSVQKQRASPLKLKQRAERVRRLKQKQQAENARRLKKYLLEQGEAGLAGQVDEIMKHNRGGIKRLFKSLVDQFGGQLTYHSVAKKTTNNTGGSRKTQSKKSRNISKVKKKSSGGGSATRRLKRQAKSHSVKNKKTSTNASRNRNMQSKKSKKVNTKKKIDKAAIIPISNKKTQADSTE